MISARRSASMKRRRIAASSAPPAPPPSPAGDTPSGGSGAEGADHEGVVQISFRPSQARDFSVGEKTANGRSLAGKRREHPLHLGVEARPGDPLSAGAVEKQRRTR